MGVNPHNARPDPQASGAPRWARNLTTWRTGRSGHRWSPRRRRGRGLAGVGPVRRRHRYAAPATSAGIGAASARAGVRVRVRGPAQGRQRADGAVAAAPDDAVRHPRRRLQPVQGRVPHDRAGHGRLPRPRPDLCRLPAAGLPGRLGPPRPPHRSLDRRERPRLRRRAGLGDAGGAGGHCARPAVRGRGREPDRFGRLSRRADDGGRGVAGGGIAVVGIRPGLALRPPARVHRGADVRPAGPAGDGAVRRRGPGHRHRGAGADQGHAPVGPPGQTPALPDARHRPAGGAGDEHGGVGAGRRARRRWPWSWG